MKVFIAIAFSCWWNDHRVDAPIKSIDERRSHNSRNYCHCQLLLNRKPPTIGTFWKIIQTFTKSNWTLMADSEIKLAVFSFLCFLTLQIKWWYRKPFKKCCIKMFTISFDNRFLYKIQMLRFNQSRQFFVPFVLCCVTKY